MALTIFDASQAPSNQPNILDNGGFEIWQRGTSFSSVANSVYTADRWKYNNNTGTMNITQESTTKRSDSNFSLKGVQTGISASNFLFQDVEDFAEYRNRTLTVSMWISTSTASALRIALNDGVTTVNSSFHTGSGTFELITATISVSSSNTRVRLLIEIAANCTFFLDNAMLTSGATAATYVPGHPAVELARCQRYYYRIGGRSTNDYVGMGQFTTASALFLVVRFPVTMRTTPTATVTNSTGFSAWQTNSTETVISGGITPQSMTTDSLLLGCGVAATGVAGQASMFLGKSTSSFIDVSADL